MINHTIFVTTLIKILTYIIMEKYCTIADYLQGTHLTKDKIKSAIIEAAIANAQEPTQDRREAIADCLGLFADIIDNLE